MVKDYTEQIYLPAAASFELRSAEGARFAGELQTWHEHLAEHWHGLHFGEIRVSQADGFWLFTVQVYLGELAPDAVRVQLFADAQNSGRPAVVEMRRGDPITGNSNGFAFTTVVPADRPAEDFTARIVPFHKHAMIPAEENAIHWAR
jgi:starch phosphorylase